MGSLPWPARPGLAPTEFISGLHELMNLAYHHRWSVKDKNNNTLLVAFGVRTPGFVVLDDYVWSPKASVRQKLEAGIVLFDALKDELIILIQSELALKKYYERLSDYHILRRIGTFIRRDSYQEAQFQTRT